MMTFLGLVVVVVLLEFVLRFLLQRRSLVDKVGLVVLFTIFSLINVEC